MGKPVEVDSTREARDLIAAAPGLSEALLAGVACGVMVCDVRAEGQPIVYVNPAFARITGYAAEEAIGRNCRFLQGPGTGATAVRLMREAIRRGEQLTATVLNYRRDGTEFWSEVRLAPLPPADRGDRSGAGGEAEIHHYLGLLSDATMRVGTESVLAQAEVLRSNVFDSMVEGVMVLDIRGAVIGVNPSAMHILGLGRDDLAAADWWSRLQVRHADGRRLDTSASPGLVATQSSAASSTCG